MEPSSQQRRYNATYKPLSNGPTAEKIETEGKKWTLVWRLVNIVTTVFFLLCAYVQLNDPDPYIWVPVYLVPAVLSLAIIVKPDITGNIIWKTICVVHIALCLAGMIYLTVIVVEILSGKIVNPLEHEEGRELGGIVITLCWLCVCRFTQLGSTQPSKGNAGALLLVTLVLGTFPLAVWGLCFIGDLHHKLGHCKDMFI